MEVKTRLTKFSTSHTHNHQRRAEFIDDESSTDSGCSSGGSTGSAEHLSRSTHGDCCYLNRLRGHHDRGATRSQERLSRSSVSSSGQRGRQTKSRSWSPSETRRHTRESPSHSSSSPSDAHSTDSDSLKRTPKTEILRRALQFLKLGKWENHGKEKKLTKKSPKRILREPVSYTYIRGLSGLPTQRVPRNPVQQLSTPCACLDTLTLYRKNLGCR